MGVSLFSVHRSTVTIEGVLRRQARAFRRLLGSASVLRAATTAHDALRRAPPAETRLACAHGPRRHGGGSGKKMAGEMRGWRRLDDDAHEAAQIHDARRDATRLSPRAAGR
jgi:hypothetical protein